MRSFSRVLLFNVLAVLAYSLGARALLGLTAASPSQALEGTALVLVGLILIHAAVAFLAGFILLVLGKKELGLGFMASSFVVLGVGSAACFGIALVHDLLWPR